MYKIAIDRARNLVEVTLGGLMTVEEVADYIAELQRQFIANHMRSYVMIIDVSQAPIQSQEMIRAMGQHMAAMPKAQAIAVVTGSSLARMQIKRLFMQSYSRIVTTIDEARTWVLLGRESHP